MQKISNLVHMPPIFARVINTLPDYRHDHLILMTALRFRMSSFLVPVGRKKSFI